VKFQNRQLQSGWYEELSNANIFMFADIRIYPLYEVLL